MTCRDCKYYFLGEKESYEYIGSLLNYDQESCDLCQATPGNPIDISNREGLKPCKEFEEKE